MSFISGTVGAVLGSEAQDDATQANLDAARETNELNYRMFLQSRGSTGHALLPYYFGDQEANLAHDLSTIYNASREAAGGYDEQLERYRRDIGQFSDMTEQAANTAKGIFDGTLENESLTNFQPVAEARVEGANARKAAGLEALQETLNEIKAVQAGKGFSGDSFGNRLLQTSARRKVYSDAATDMAGVNIQNASDTFGIHERAQARRVSNLSLPYAMAQQAVNSENLADNAILDQTARRQQLFNFFKMAPGQFTYQPMPTVSASASPWQALAAGVGTGNTILAKYLLDKYGNTAAAASAPSIYDSSSALTGSTWESA